MNKHSWTQKDAGGLGRGQMNAKRNTQVRGQAQKGAEKNDRERGLSHKPDRGDNQTVDRNKGRRAA